MSSSTGCRRCSSGAGTTSAPSSAAKRCRSGRATTSWFRAPNARPAATASPRSRTSPSCRGLRCAASARPAARTFRRATRWSKLLGGALAAAAIWRFGPTWEGLAACGLLWTLLALTFIDFDTQLLPDDITLPLLWAGLAVNLFGVFVPLRDAVIGAIAGYLALWTVYWLFKLIRGKEGMGYGDFKLLAALGAWLGWHMIIPDHTDVLRRRRIHRHHAGRLQGARPQHPAGVRAVPGHRRRHRTLLRPVSPDRFFP